MKLISSMQHSQAIGLTGSAMNGGGQRFLRTLLTIAILFSGLPITILSTPQTAQAAVLALEVYSFRSGGGAFSTPFSDCATQSPSSWTAGEDYCDTSGIGPTTRDPDTIVRTNDRVTYQFAYNITGPFAAGGGSNSNATTISSTLPVGMQWISLPAQCAVGGIPNPGSGIFDLVTGSGDRRVLRCNVGDYDGVSAGAQGYVKSFYADARVLGSLYNGTVVTVGGSISSTANTPVAASVIATNTVSAAPKYDLVKPTASVVSQPEEGPNGEDGFNVRWRIDIYGPNTASLGNEPLAMPLVFSDTGAYSSTFPANFVLMDWGGISPCYANTAPAGTITCAQSAPGGPIGLVITGFNVTTPGASGLYATYFLNFWVPITDVNNAGGSLLITNTLSNFDPNSVSGVSNYGPGLEPLTNNRATHTLNTNTTGFWQKRYLKTATANLDNTTSANANNGLVVTGQRFLTRLTLNNTSNSLMQNVMICDKFDNMRMVVTDGLPGNAVRMVVSHAAGGTVITPTYVAEYGTGGSPGLAYWANTNDQQYATCDNADSTAGWFTSTLNVPGGRDAITKVRIRFTSDIEAKINTITYITQTVRNTFAFGPNAGQPMPVGEMVPNYATYKWSGLPGWVLEGTGGANPNAIWSSPQHGYLANHAFLTRMVARITKATEPAILGALNAGDGVTFTLTPNFTMAVSDTIATNVTITDVMPQYLTYVPGTATYNGLPFPPTIIYGSTSMTLVWQLPGTVVTSSTTLPVIRFRAVTAGDTPNGTALTNRAYIYTPDDLSDIASRTSTRAVNVSNQVALGVGKETSTPFIEPGDLYTYTIYYSNVDPTAPVPGVDSVDVFPFNGDGRLPASIIAPGGTQFVSASLMPSMTIYYTNTASALVPRLPISSTASQWCAGPLPGAAPCNFNYADVTAIRIRDDATLPPYSSTLPLTRRVVTLTFDSNGSNFGNIFTNRFSASPTGIGLAAVSNDVPVQLIPGIISGRVYRDSNMNGGYDVGEMLLSGVLMTLTGFTNSGVPVLVNATTNGSGMYTFTNLFAGNYTITEQQPSGFLDYIDTPGTAGGSVNNTPADMGNGLLSADQISNITLLYGGASYNNNFGEIQPGTINAIVRLGTQFGSIIQGVTITLTGVNVYGQSILQTGVTPNSTLQFANLVPGTYTVTELQPLQYLDGPDYNATPAGILGNDVISQISLGSGVNTGIYTFVEFGATLGDQVFFDLNQNGIQDPGEYWLNPALPPSIAAVNVAGTSGAPLSVSPNITGYYQAAQLPPDTYTVTRNDSIWVNNYGYSRTTPQTLTVPLLTAGQVVTTADFGYFGLDCGDLPDGNAALSPNYPTLRANGGPCHVRTLNLGLGSSAGINPDMEIDGQPSPNAMGDDLTLVSDENGFQSYNVLQYIAGQTVTAPISTYASGSLFSYTLYVFADWNGNGILNDPGEVTTKIVSSLSGFIVHNIPLTIPLNADTSQQIGLRIRVATDPNLGPTGLTMDGEVEDYLIQVQQPTKDCGDLPDGNATNSPNYHTLAGNNGPCHAINPLLKIGNLIDAENNGQPNATATGDGADEDGISFSPFILGQSATITGTPINNTATDAWIYFFIDWNANGVLNDAGEVISLSVPAGSTNTGAFNLVVPFTANLLQQIGMRVRLSTDPALGPDGYTIGGEVEDYLIQVTSVSKDCGDLPQNSFGGSYHTTVSQNGPCHGIDPLLKIGATIDGENDGQPTLGATGDGSDEDGINYSAFINGAGGTITRTVFNATGNNAWIYFFIDWDSNYTFSANETISFPVPPGTNSTTVFTVTPPFYVGAPSAYLAMRVRLSLDPNLGPDGYSSIGEVEDYIVPFYEVDWGDLPDDPSFPLSYHTLRTSNGPSHIISNDLSLGTQPDGDSGLLTDMNAIDDDQDNIDDEDGVYIGYPIAGLPMVAQVIVNNGLNTNAVLYGFIDFNGDSSFSASESVSIVIPANLQTSVPITFNVPVNALVGSPLGARFRISTDPNLGPDGPAPDGEIEDYVIYIDSPSNYARDFGDLPEPPSNSPNYYHTLEANNGPSHLIWNVFIGNTSVDAELDGQPNSAATGDDANVSDDENGVVMPVFTPGQTASVLISITNQAGTDVYAYGFIDFNGDYIFSPNESVILTIPYTGFSTPVQYVMTFTVPATASVGLPLGARFRVSSDAGLGPNGLAPDGEVEDYMIPVPYTHL
ncbi:MAG: GEVED domain-containing protein, partial [Anaerolineae bacterium]|nr:GEVED domain-containing protein [Anaerolineae bacterium]